MRLIEYPDGYSLGTVHPWPFSGRAPWTVATTSTRLAGGATGTTTRGNGMGIRSGCSRSVSVVGRVGDTRAGGARTDSAQTVERSSVSAELASRSCRSSSLPGTARCSVFDAGLAIQRIVGILRASTYLGRLSESGSTTWLATASLPSNGSRCSMRSKDAVPSAEMLQRSWLSTTAIGRAA
jgi:hypothetical protein